MSSTTPASQDPTPLPRRDRTRHRARPRPHGGDLWLPAGVRMAGTETTPIDTLFQYDPDDPFAVTVTFSVPTLRPVVWVMSRDLLLEGLDRPSGTGHVRISPGAPAVHRMLLIELRRSGAAVTVAVDHARVAVWLRATCERVPRGRECAHLDWDAALTELLADPGR